MPDQTKSQQVRAAGLITFAAIDLMVIAVLTLFGVPWFLVFVAAMLGAAVLIGSRRSRDFWDQFEREANYDDESDVVRMMIAIIAANGGSVEVPPKVLTGDLPATLVRHEKPDGTVVFKVVTPHG